MNRRLTHRDIWFACELKELLRSDDLLAAGWNALQPLLTVLNLPDPVPREDAVLSTQTHTTGRVPDGSDGAVAELLYAAIPPSAMCDPKRVRSDILKLFSDPASFVLSRRIRAMRRRGELKGIASNGNCSVSELLACFCTWVVTRGHETQIIAGDAFGGAAHVYRTYLPLWQER